MTEIEIKTTELSWEKYLQLERIHIACKKIKGFLILGLNAKESIIKHNYYGSDDTIRESIRISYPESKTLTVTITAIKHN